MSGLLHIKGLLCKQVKQLEPSLHCLRLRRGAGKGAEVRYAAPAEPLGDAVRGARSGALIRGRCFHRLFLTSADLSDVAPQVSDQLEVVPASVFTLRMSKLSGGGDFGERHSSRLPR